MRILGYYGNSDTNLAYSTTNVLSNTDISSNALERGIN